MPTTKDRKEELLEDLMVATYYWREATTAQEKKAFKRLKDVLRAWKDVL